MSISDWSSDVCSSDLPCLRSLRDPARFARYAFASPLRGSLGQTVVPCSRIRLRCSACFTARCRTRPRITALRLINLRFRRTFHQPPAVFMTRVMFPTSEQAQHWHSTDIIRGCLKIESVSDREEGLQSG